MSKAEEALNVIKEEMKNDSSYAWAWHCNLAMMAFDSGAPHRESNIRAADLMKSVFDVDIKESKQFKDLMG